MKFLDVVLRLLKTILAYVNCLRWVSKINFMRVKCVKYF